MRRIVRITLGSFNSWTIRLVSPTAAGKLAYDAIAPMMQRKAVQTSLALERVRSATGPKRMWGGPPSVRRSKALAPVPPLGNPPPHALLPSWPHRITPSRWLTPVDRTESDMRMSELDEAQERTAFVHSSPIALCNRATSALRYACLRR